ncbi:MAG: NAD(P)-dependent oxidoreductase [Lachnospiraceae bacterium]|nr:NAD(P)-dependent oxidoreductase [Lachnospiraceae bacterium]
MKTAIVTGAAGFAGCHLTKTLSENGYRVYAVLRPGSTHNGRLAGLNNVVCIEADVYSDETLSSLIPGQCDLFFHMAWMSGGRYDYDTQMRNAWITLRMAKLASETGCRRFVGIGSQAEYGSTEEEITEDTWPAPFCAYGVSKLAACYLSKQIAEENGMEWVWGRIFSVYGENEPAERLIPRLMESFQNGSDISLSSCRQNWDFLYGKDAGEALLAIAEKGGNGEIYNIADGRYRPLKEYVEIINDIYGKNSSIPYGEDPKPFVSLQPSVEKLKRDTGWVPKTDFRTKIQELKAEMT